MSRNIVPRVNKGADLGTAEKNWNRLFADAVILRGSDLKTLLDGKVNLDTLTAKGDLYVATDAGVITRLPRGMDGYVLKANSAVSEGLMWGPAGARQELTGNITVTVGNNGDFPTINAALENITSLYYPKYISGGNCPRVTINLLPDFIMSEQVLVESLDLSWITISGVDSETIINRSALVKAFYGRYPAFGVTNGGFLPIINQLFNMDTSGSSTLREGIQIDGSSRAIIKFDCGVENAGECGLVVVRNSIAFAERANFTYANQNGIYVANGSIVSAIGVNVSNTVSYGISVWDGSIVMGLNAIGTSNIAPNTLTAHGIRFGPLAS